MAKPFSYLLLPLVIFYLETPGAMAQACVTGTLGNQVAWNRKNNMTISNLRINPANGNPCISLSNCYNITITNCILGPSSGYGILLTNCYNITITGNSFMNNSSGVKAQSCTGGIKVNNNQFANVDGPSPDGHLVQFANCSDTGNEINNNVAEDVLGINSNPNDLINIFESSGTPASPILINGNMLRGGGPGGSSGGILAGDEGGSYITVSNNILVNPGQYGLAVPAGTNISIRNNELYGQEQHFTNVGVYMYKFYPSDACGYDTVQGNQVYFVDSLGILSSDYIPIGVSGVSCAPIVDTLNNWNAPIGPGILPSRLLCPLLMTYYKFNSNWGDSSGSGLTATPVNMAFAGQGEDLIAANFNGTSAYLTAAISPWLTPLTERITVSCWIKPMTTSGIQGIAQSQNGDGYDNGWRMLLNAGNYNIRMTTAGGVADFDCGSVSPGVWTLLTMTYDGQWVRGYINGVLEDSTALTGNITYSGSSPMKIGYCNGTNYYFNGYMDEFKFYDGNLLDSEVLQYYNASVSLVNSPSPEVRAFYYFDDNWSDATGYHLDATDNAATFVCDGEAYSANFSGSSYLTLPQSPLLNPYSSTFSVAYWIKPSTVSGQQSIAQAENSDGYDNGWRMILNNNALDGRVVTNEGAVDVLCGCIQAGVWQYVVMTYDGTALRLYVNGTLEATTTEGGYIVYGSSSLAEIGRCNGVGDLNGRLDLFQFWDGPVSATSVQQSYYYWLPTFEAGPNCPQITSATAGSADINPGPDGPTTYSVYPNPAVQTLTIQLADPQKQSTQPELIQAELFTVTGQILKSQSGHGSALTINVAGLKSGIYILRVTHSGHVETTKVVIPH